MTGVQTCALPIFIYQATGSRHLYKLINNLRYMVLRVRAVGLQEESEWRNSWDEHNQLIDHLVRRDKKAASNLMTRHIEAAASHAAQHAKQSAGRGRRAVSIPSAVDA